MKQFNPIIMLSITALIIIFYAGCEPQEKTVVTDTEPAVIEALAEPVVIEAPAEPPVKVEVPSPAAIVEEAKPEPEPIEDTPIAVTVNGIDILETDINAQIDSQLERMASQMPPQYLEQYKSQMRQQVIETMIVEQLLGNEVKDKNIYITDEDVTIHLEKTGASQQPPLSLEDIKALIEARGQNFEETKEQIKKGLSFQQLMEEEFSDQVNFTEEDARKYYDENPKKFESPEQTRASHILIKTDASDPNFDNEAARAKADQILVKIKAGDNFATLARENSACPSASKGGDLGLFGKGQMVPAFEKAAIALEIGQVSEVVETEFGYHIITKTGYQPATTTSFDEAREMILENLAKQKRSELAKEYVDSLKGRADIVYPPGKEPKPRPPMPTRPRPVRPRTE